MDQKIVIMDQKNVHTSCRFRSKTPSAIITQHNEHYFPSHVTSILPLPPKTFYRLTEKTKKTFWAVTRVAGWQPYRLNHWGARRATLPPQTGAVARLTIRKQENRTVQWNVRIRNKSIGVNFGTNSTLASTK